MQIRRFLRTGLSRRLRRAEAGTGAEAHPGLLPCGRSTSSSSISACPTWTARSGRAHSLLVDRADHRAFGALGEAQKVRLLEIGADDYVVKPFGIAELLARVRVTP